MMAGAAEPEADDLFPPAATAPPPSLRGRLLANPARHDSKPAAARQTIEAVVIARGGGVMIVGWINDHDLPIDAVTITCGGWRVTFDADTLARVRRMDVEQALPGAPASLFGFFGLIAAPGLEDLEDRAAIDIQLVNGGHLLSEFPTRIVSAAELRDLALGYLASASFFGDPHVEAVASLEPGLGPQLVALNQAITKRIVAARHIERFGTPRRQPLASIIVCLYGRAEFLFVQNALFAGRPGIADYEFIFVLNSPEIADAVVREARLAHRIYGLNQSVVLLPGNAGFGAANNAGVLAARSRRILNVNPDVFPLQDDWAARHNALVTALPAQQTQLFGVPLYYDNGSLMHGGMYFELDSVASIRGGAIERRRLLRVEHYGKGAPDWAASYTASRPVPAVTGAFMSTDRIWYERLGGFTEDYVFGHYEDADLCLKSLDLGTPSWMHDIRLWHLEGKGSTRQPHHEGGTLVNRWLFSKTWLPLVSAGLLGPDPASKAMGSPG
jgi:GT2 family glycosyltransferase